jgi:malonyl-CoA O-methyltransferase
MPRGLFITGTDTNVGKTVVAAALMHRFRRLTRLRYWKPIQTGIEQDDDTAVVRRLGECQESELLTRGVRLARPLSPHLSAQLGQTTIRIADLEKLTAGESESCRWAVEGAGGVLVPINESQLMIDLMLALSFPVLVVARSGLGTINHTLLTLEALRSRKLDVAGVVMVGERNRDNSDAIERFGKTAVLGAMPYLQNLTPEAVRLWSQSELDRDGVIDNLLK